MPYLWVAFTLAASVGQTARNAMQRGLTSRLGPAGATHVRFLFGLPFALGILLAVLLVTGDGLPRTNIVFWFWIAVGAASQILATGLMLLTMMRRSFVVTTAYLKTEPVQVALLGLIVLGDRLSLPAASAILIATVGVMLISWTPTTANADRRSVLFGLLAASCFALSAIGYRGAVKALSTPDYVMAATASLVVGLVLQSSALSALLAWREPATLRKILRLWRPSLLAGMLGAVASEFWFLAFTLATAASVRTLALVEVLFAQGISHLVFKQKTTAREIAGIALIVGGCGFLVWVQR